MENERLVQKLNGKSILFISPSFFNYENKIVDELSKCGANVYYFDDRPDNGTLSKILIRLNPKLRWKKTSKYYASIISRLQTIHIDYVFFIKCEAPLENDLKNLREAFNEAQFILYMYDSINNIKFYDMKKNYFDKIYTFDTNDSENYHEMVFRPLFYIEDYEANDYVNLNYKYLVSFIGSNHSDRAKIINSLKKKLDMNNEPYYFRLYFPSKLVYRIQSIVSKDIRELRRAGIVSFDKITSLQVSEITNDSYFILDIQHPRQTGLTMRTIEMIGMNKKIVTTNRNITKYDFYSENNIEVIDREKLIIDLTNMKSGYKIIDKNTKENYTLKEWINTIFGGKYE